MTPVDRIAHLNRWRHKSLVEKSVFCLGMLAITLTLPPLKAGPLVIAATLIATLWAARVPAQSWLVLAMAPLGFLLAGLIPVVMVFDHGYPALAPGGPETALVLMVRSFAALSCLLALALTTPATDLTAGLRRLGVPAELTDIALLMLRFIFLLADTAKAMDAAQAARLGHQGLFRRIRSAGLVAGNLLPRAMDRARRMEAGLAARGWTGEMRVLRTPTPISPRGLTTILALEAAIILLAGGLG